MESCDIKMYSIYNRDCIDQNSSNLIPRLSLEEALSSVHHLAYAKLLPLCVQ